jgi:hypothetical protein
VYKELKYVFLKYNYKYLYIIYRMPNLIIIQQFCNQIGWFVCYEPPREGVSQYHKHIKPLFLAYIPTSSRSYSEITERRHRPVRNRGKYEHS